MGFISHSHDDSNRFRSWRCPDDRVRVHLGLVVETHPFGAVNQFDAGRVAVRVGPRASVDELSPRLSAKPAEEGALDLVRIDRKRTVPNRRRVHFLTWGATSKQKRQYNDYACQHTYHGLSALSYHDVTGFESGPSLTRRPELRQGKGGIPPAALVKCFIRWANTSSPFPLFYGESTWLVGVNRLQMLTWLARGSRDGIAWSLVSKP